MKKIKVIFAIFCILLFCSVSFAGSNKTGKMLDAAEITFDSVSIINNITEGTEIIDVASDVKDIAALGATGVAVAGASGTGIMSTMAATGAVVGGEL